MVGGWCSLIYGFIVPFASICYAPAIVSSWPFQTCRWMLRGCGAKKVRMLAASLWHKYAQVLRQRVNLFVDKAFFNKLYSHFHWPMDDCNIWSPYKLVCHVWIMSDPPRTTRLYYSNQLRKIVLNPWVIGFLTSRHVQNSPHTWLLKTLDHVSTTPHLHWHV